MTTAARACPACRTPLPEEAHFCLHCGTPTPTEPGVPPRTAATEVTEIARVQNALAGRGYTVERVLGEGGMATVYLATDMKHRRQVAVKVMRPDLAATLGAERFLREVEIAAQLSHPHILPVHDSGDANGVLFYVMPYVEGESLHERIRRETQLPVEEALRIAREVAEALAYAHGRKIVHRDMKPGNIMLSAGHALVADFGIARAVGVGGERRGRLLQMVVRDVDRDVAVERRSGIEEDPDLVAGSAAKLDQRAAAAEQQGDLLGMLRQKAELGACRIVFRLSADLLEQPGALLVVEIFGGNAFLSGVQPVQNRIAKRLERRGIDLKSVGIRRGREARGRSSSLETHEVSFRSSNDDRRPKNGVACEQSWCRSGSASYPLS
jgi:serine/threonine protein kinase